MQATGLSFCHFPVSKMSKWGRGGFSGAKFQISLGLTCGCHDQLCQKYRSQKSVNHLHEGEQGMAAQTSCHWRGWHGDGHGQERHTPELWKNIDPAVAVWQQKQYWRKDAVFLYFKDNAGVIVNNKHEMKVSVITGTVAKVCNLVAQGCMLCRQHCLILQCICKK